MSIFGSYARYYDLLYQDKDYQQEANFILQLLQTHAPQARSLLELGCGTGRHAEHLLQAGYSITGVERSPEMLAICQQRQAHLPSAKQSAITLVESDLRTVRLEQQFDVVLALFHVISYQSSNNDLQAAFATARKHLKPGGRLIFDVWYGPAVLSDRPVPRIKQVTADDCTITRFAQPTLYPNDNWVDVHYYIHIQDHVTQKCESLEETHRMRYLFRPELHWLLRTCNLEIIANGEWLTNQPMGFESWNTYFVVANQ